MVPASASTGTSSTPSKKRNVRDCDLASELQEDDSDNEPDDVVTPLAKVLKGAYGVKPKPKAKPKQQKGMGQTEKDFVDKMAETAEASITGLVGVDDFLDLPVAELQETEKSLKRKAGQLRGKGGDSMKLLDRLQSLHDQISAFIGAVVAIKAWTKRKSLATGEAMDKPFSRMVAVGLGKDRLPACMPPIEIKRCSSVRLRFCHGSPGFESLLLPRASAYRFDGSTLFGFWRSGFEGRLESKQFRMFGFI